MFKLLRKILTVEFELKLAEQDKIIYRLRVDHENLSARFERMANELKQWTTPVEPPKPGQDENENPFYGVRQPKYFQHIAQTLLNKVKQQS